ncbi:MAG: hypothetical protein SFU83_11750 [Meiothermus sp.]|nr:hypothetical protein [Meiothermus sp.]
MKKTVAPLIVFFALMFGSLGSAQSNGFGIYSGFPEWLGIQYQTNGLRLGAGLSFSGLGGSADLIILESPLPVAPGFELSWYAGAGVSAGFWLFRTLSGIYIFPHGLAGIEYKFPDQSFSVYGELQLGIGIGLGNLSGAYGGFDFNSRVGIIFPQ